MERTHRPGEIAFFGRFCNFVRNTEQASPSYCRGQHEKLRNLKLVIIRRLIALFHDGMYYVTTNFLSHTPGYV